MGEIAEMMLDGTLCEGCGEFIGEGDGFPQYCSPQCAGDRGADEAQVKGYGSDPQTKSEGRRRRKKNKQENYRDMQSLLQKTSNMILKSMAGEEVTKGEWNNHNQAIVARLMRVR